MFLYECKFLQFCLLVPVDCNANKKELICSFPSWITTVTSILYCEN